MGLTNPPRAVNGRNGDFRRIPWISCYGGALDVEELAAGLDVEFLGLRLCREMAVRPRAALGGFRVGENWKHGPKA